MKRNSKIAIMAAASVFCFWSIVASSEESSFLNADAPSIAADYFDPPPLLNPKDLISPGKDPEEEDKGNETGWTVEEWEKQRLRFTRAEYLVNVKQRDRAYKCLPDGKRAVDYPSAWKSRVRNPNSEKLLPLTEEVQQAIYAHQHPKDCRANSTRFVVWRLWNTGLGADLHTLAQAIGYAMATERVLLIDTSETWWYAMDRYPASLECFFIPPSNCKLSDAGDRAVLMPPWVLNRKTNRMMPSTRLTIKKEGPRSVSNPLRKSGDVGNKWSLIPRLRWRQYGYQWWMAQTVRYLLRQPQPWFQEKFKKWVDETFPNGVPNKMIGMHVRHGDKYKEMKLIELPEYLKAAAELREKEPDLRHIFLSTEDPGVLEESKNYEKEGWIFHWTKNNRSNVGSPMDYAMLVGPSMLGEISFVNLLIQELHCTHWIGTDKSNWNRLINELRLTTGFYGAPYVQLNKQSCVGNPILGVHDPVPGWVMGC
eukprot:TRINITY_DN19819_c0_g1_i1.p1 TRINITY_DN19819_c0_g1~~TRINITY_DN19819_c0_g1_i1.p1  ORF type:complete len:492 (+),score=83.55 TRINITY_DN19819_c0_g1_i1:37-1476(+)